MATAGPPSVKVGQIVHAAGRRAVRVEIEHRGVVHWIDGDRDHVGVGGGPVAGHDRERVAAVEVEVAGIGEARQRRVDLRCCAGDAYAGAAVAGDAGAGGHIEDAARHIERGGERAAVDVRHRDAGDRQDGVLGDALRGRHGIDRGVVHWIDGDRDRVGVDGGPVVGRDRERVGAVEVEVAGIGEARQRRVDLHCRAGDGYAGAAVAADAGAGGHIEDAVSDRQRGGERAAVDVRHRDAGDRQDGVLGDALRGPARY